MHAWPSWSYPCRPGRRAQGGGDGCADGQSRHLVCVSDDQTPGRPGAGPSGLALRYRPHRFADLVGQRHVAAVLREAVRSDAPPQQILLSGGSGLGKTTAARIFAAALLCELPADGDACGTCASCQDVAAGVHPDVIEMDAASNGGKDEVNELAARARTMPMRGRWKVYVVDEAHGLTRAGGEAFLKLLEEPPPHVVFLLATTDPDKMLSTNRGRCLELELSAPGTDEVADHLLELSRREGWALPREAAVAVVERSDPGLGVRGAVMGLSKLSGPLSRSEPVTDELLAEYLGWLPSQRVARLFDLVESHQVPEALDEAAELVRAHGDGALRQALVNWARAGLRDGTDRAVWRLETVASTPPGPLWTESLVARLASPAFDGTPASTAALVEEARSLLEGLEEATTSARRAREEIAVAVPPVPARDAAPAQEAPPAEPATSKASDPGDVPAYDGPPPEEWDYGPPPEEWDDGGSQPPPDRRRTGGKGRRSQGAGSAGTNSSRKSPARRNSKDTAGDRPGPASRETGKEQRKESGNRAPQGQAPATAAVPTAATSQLDTPQLGTSGKDPWFDDPAAYDTRPVQAPQGPPVSAEEVHAAVRARHPGMAPLLAACQLVLRDGALFVVVPAHLAQQVRSSSMRDDLAALMEDTPVHFRVKK